MERIVEMTPEQRSMAINLGALGYSIDRCAVVMDEGMTLHPEFKALYEKGCARGEYVIDLKLLELSQQGDLKALAKMEQRKRASNRK